MLQTDLVVGQDVVLGDVWTGKEGEKESGVGYKVTAIRDSFVECTNDKREDHNRTKYYGRNDLHLIKKVSDTLEKAS